MKKKLIIGGLLLFLISIIYLIKPYYLFIKNTLKISLIKTLLSRDSLITYNNQVNILALGIAGGTHEGPNLSDSIMVINYNFKTNQITTISLPRDIWSETLKDKINTAYAYGEAKQKDGGLKLARAEIESIIGIPIQYGAVIDFEFKNLIDFLGGIDVDVEQSFVDKQFPIEGKENDLCGDDKEYRCRYQTVSFNKGLNHMDGETTLKFVRSRHARDEEGSDFARAKRQQKVLIAVKDKLLRSLDIRNIQQIEKIYSILNNLISRDITNQQVAIIAKNIIFQRNLKQQQIVLTEDFFIVPDYMQYEEKYVLVPQSGNFDNIHEYIACNINSTKDCEELKQKGKKD